MGSFVLGSKELRLPAGTVRLLRRMLYEDLAGCEKKKLHV